jgi:hypothetical protein
MTGPVMDPIVEEMLMFGVRREKTERGEPCSSGGGASTSAGASTGSAASRVATGGGSVSSTFGFGRLTPIQTPPTPRIKAPTSPMPTKSGQVERAAVGGLEPVWAVTSGLSVRLSSTLGATTGEAGARAGATASAARSCRRSTSIAVIEG